MRSPVQVLGGAAVAAQPSQCSLDDPAARENHEAFCHIGSLDDLDGPFADTPECLLSLSADRRRS